MATDTVGVFAPVQFGFEDHRIKAMDGDGDVITGVHTPYQEKYGMPFDEIDSTKDSENVINLSTKQRKGRENDYLKENSTAEVNGNHDAGKRNAEKKKRNPRKKNRCDMSPEELRRLRERERKAQQSRRDRIRAQKRQNQGWHEEDAAWEAFMDETNDKPGKKKKRNSSMPSMVCQAETTKPKAPPDDNNIDFNQKAEGSNNEKAQIFESHESKEDSESNSGSLHDHQSSLYSSDDSSNQEVKDSKKLSRRHYLPSDELEKLRKRERDAKRKQREKYRQTIIQGFQDDSKSTNEEELHSQNTSKPLFTNFEKKNNKNCSLSPVNHKIPEQKEVPENIDHCYKEDFHYHVNHSSMHHRNHLLPSSPPLHAYHARHFYGKLSPRVHHRIDYHSPVLYMPEHNHQYSPTDKQFVPKEKHYRNHTLHDSRDRQREHYDNGYSSKYMTTNQLHPHPQEKLIISHDSQSSKTDHNSPPGEKKKMISRNVDRKKLSEEELEELRRRERDYQRERRARIRMEKAKTQQQQEQLHYKRRQSFSPEGFYHHPPHAYLSHHAHGVDRALDRISRYEDHFDHNESSPHCVKQEKMLSETETKEHTKELQVTIPDYENDEHGKQNTSANESDLLQVVPKTREYEEKESTERKTPVINSPSEIIPSTNTEKKSKKIILETICSSLKKDSSAWTGDEDDRLVVDINEEKENTQSCKNDSMDFEENLAQLKQELLCSNDDDTINKASKLKVSQEKITEEQLERRRRSNREAQRRRRARLKMQGMEERSDVSNDNQAINLNDYDNAHSDDMYEFKKHCHVKVQQPRPDSLCMHHDMHSHYYYNKDTRYHDVTQDKYGHYIPDPYYGKHIYFPMARSPHRKTRDFEDQHFHHDRNYPREHYLHDFGGHHRPRHFQRERESHQSYHNHQKQHSAQSSPTPDINPNNKKHSQEDETKRSPILSPKITSAKNDNNTSKEELLNETNETLSKSGRKRKQFAPRKVLTSSNTTPDNDDDDMNDEACIPLDEEQPSRVVILGENDTLYDVASNFSPS